MDQLYFLETYIPDHHADLRHEVAEARLIKAATTANEHANSTHPIAASRIRVRKAVRILRDWLREPREVTNATPLS